jgi:hypothetical protein
MTNNQSIAALDIDEREEAQALEQPLPLVLEIIPGQAGEGLIDVYEAGSYEQKTLKDLIRQTLKKEAWSIEEQQVLDDIRRQLTGGKILWRGQEIDGKASFYAVLEHTEAGEKYLYVPARIIKPQEGGALAESPVLWSSR